VLDPSFRDKESPAYISSSSDSLALDPELVRTDLEEFRSASRELGEPGSVRMRRSAAERMVQLARGEFLVDLRYEDWVAEAQAAVHSEIRLHLLPLAQGDPDIPPDLSIKAATALIALDRYDEGAHLALVDRLLATGRKVAAREALRRYASLLATELEEEPTPEVRAAFALVRLNLEEVNSDLTNPRPPLTSASRGT
jgi:DNA-binding SARP family transcriptional activator